MIGNGVAATQAYTAVLVYPGGGTKDVTDETLFSIDASFGSFAASTVTVHSSGKHLIQGLYKAKAGTAMLIARLRSRRVEPPLDPNTPDLFEGTEDAARAPNLVYPAADTTMPRNLGDFEAHWTDPHGNHIFELSLATEFSDVRVYTNGGNGIAAAGPMPTWAAFTATEWGSAVGTEKTISFRVRGVQAAMPGIVGVSAPRAVKLSNEPMEGGLYYWAATASAGAYGIFRHDMSKPGQPAEEFMTTNQTAGRCVACHSLSRDGKQMAITYDGGNGAATTVDVATATARASGGAWNFATYTPDGSRLITVHQGTMVVRDPVSQAPLATVPAGGPVSHPDISADGTRLVYVREPGGADWSFDGGQIFTRSFDPVTNAFGGETPLVTTGVNNFYPSWSPDGQWVLFNRSDSGTAYNNVNASLWVVKSDGSGQPIQLAAFNAAGGLTNSWGRWAPFAQTVGDTAESIFWITVSSQRDFGVRLLNSQSSAKTPQLWMSPFHVERAGAGQDPTAPAFRLPFQNLTSNNHIAQWTERVVTTL
jgi:Tol biopolymer transport system component